MRGFQGGDAITYHHGKLDPLAQSGARSPPGGVQVGSKVSAIEMDTDARACARIHMPTQREPETFVSGHDG
eukprot:10625483-Alexandrium_andersonii.AAC.1